jgi:1D-myo-inositol-triphosphate 3-kinase
LHNHSGGSGENAKSDLKQQFVERLRALRTAFMNSDFCSTHEVIGSSLLVIHDEHKLGVWMIDFAKSVPLPPGTTVDHMSPWKLGNHEDGYLFGLNNLIRLVDSL